MPCKIIARVALITVVMLSVPLLAMQFTEEIKWTLFDFMVAGALIFSTGLTLEVVRSKIGKNRIPVAMSIIALFLYLWVELAVGIFTNWGN